MQGPRIWTQVPLAVSIPVPSGHQVVGKGGSLIHPKPRTPRGRGLEKVGAWGSHFPHQGSTSPGAPGAGKEPRAACSLLPVGCMLGAGSVILFTGSQCRQVRKSEVQWTFPQKHTACMYVDVIGVQYKTLTLYGPACARNPAIETASLDVLLLPDFKHPLEK